MTRPPPFLDHHPQNVGQYMRTSSLTLLQCPACRRGPIEAAGSDPGDEVEESLICMACGQRFPVREGIPILLVGDLMAHPTSAAFAQAPGEIRQKVLQREWHDSARARDPRYKAAAFADPGLFAFTMYYQLRVARPLLSGVEYPLIANICAGNGFELRFLAQLGRRIIVTDISHASLLEALRVGRELGVDVEAYCCDAENLPFRDGVFDLVVAHHSLHHLVDKWRGLGEMVRVGRWRVAFFEPASGPMRWLVRHLGLKPAVEESGNLVHEYGRRETAAFAATHNCRLVHFAKSLITGPPVEPPVYRLLDRSGLTRLIKGAVRGLNAMLGWAIGTKCEVLLERAVTRPRSAAAPR